MYPGLHFDCGCCQENLQNIIDHIINIHHNYVLDSIPIILEYANKVATVHGHHYTQVVEIKDLFNEVSNELLSHMHKEEEILFPYVKHLKKLKKEGVQLKLSHFGSVNNPIKMMEDEHEKAGDIFKKMIAVDSNSIPAHCNLANVALQQSNYDEAIRLKPKYIDAFYNRAKIELMGLNAKRLAIDHFNRDSLANDWTEFVLGVNP